MAVIDEMGSRARIVAPGEGREIPLPFAKSAVTVKLGAAETAGALSLFVARQQPHSVGPARHVHRTWTELFYVLSGEMTFEVDGQRRMAPAGTLVWVPPGTVHAFRNAHDEPATMLILVLPGGFEGFFAESAHLREPIAATGAWQALNETWDQTVVGPPLS